MKAAGGGMINQHLFDSGMSVTSACPGLTGHQFAALAERIHAL